MSDAQQTITAEGRTVADAVAQAAAQLGVDPTLVEHKLDLSHFKTADGRSRPVDTVKVIAEPGDGPLPSPSVRQVAPRAAGLVPGDSDVST
jgi:hypothetical protein